MRAPLWIGLLLAACGPPPEDTGSADRDEDGVSAADDCDDADPRRAPGLPEECDRLDNDCDGLVDEADPDLTDGAVWFLDADADGFGSGTDPATLCTRADGYAALPGDCDDTDPDVHASSAWYADHDGDGYGDLEDTVNACGAPSGRVADATDCDDEEPRAYPSADEACGDGVDNNCDGETNGCGPDGELALADEADRREGEAEGDQLGTALAALGDFDGDGVADYAASAPDAWDATGELEEAGGVAIYAGGSDERLAWLSGAAPQDRAGELIAGPGDTDGDGYADLLVGTPWTESGVVYLVHGPDPDPELSAATTLVGALPGFATAVSGAGDQDGDGLPDFIVGADDARFGGDTCAYVFGGLGVTDVGDALATFTRSSGSDEPGARLAALGDIDGDGFADLALSDAGYTDTASGQGAVYVFRGPVSGDLALDDADAVLLGTGANAAAGMSVAGPGDVDGDGFADLWVGGWLASDEATQGGAAWLVYGPITGQLSFAEADGVVVGDIASERVGGVVAGAGDVDGDGRPDLLVSGAGPSGAGDTRGEALLLLSPLSGTRLASDATARFVGETSGDLAGASLAGPGDLDGDGYAELLVGAPGSSSASTGTIYVITGGQGY